MTKPHIDILDVEVAKIIIAKKAYNLHLQMWIINFQMRPIFQKKKPSRRLTKSVQFQTP